MPEFFVVSYKDARKLEVASLQFRRNPESYLLEQMPKSPSVFAHATLNADADEVAVYARCGGADRELARTSGEVPKFEAEAEAMPLHRTNPVDLGSILVPKTWLLLESGAIALVKVAGLDRTADRPNAKLRAAFDGGEILEIPFALVKDQRRVSELRTQASTKTDHAVLQVSVVDGDQVLWTKDVRTMIVRKPPRWPSFGAVETKLRYDAPIAVTDSETGRPKPSIEYDTAWDRQLKDIVIALPNGSRFVFWRGSSYVPFWAGAFNTGLSYQWAETAVLPNERDRESKDFTLEPLFDKELRHSRVRVIESTQSRVHVRWSYQLLDYRYKSWGDEATEDFYFYPDSFGTRVLTVTNSPSAIFQQLSEFIVLTPQAEYPLAVLPEHMLKILSLEQGRGAAIRFPVERPVQPLDGQMIPQLGWAAEVPRWEPTLYRISPHKEDPASAIYFHPRDISALALFPPFYEEGEVVAPVYWGNHWPLTRGGWTGTATNDRVIDGPSHSSIGGPTDGPVPWYKPPIDLYESFSQTQALDGKGQPREMITRKIAWLIGYTDMPDDELRSWGKSFVHPPAVEVRGARLNIPAFTQERRAVRLVAEQARLEMTVKPKEVLVNPVFEIDGSVGPLSSVMIDGVPASDRSFRWDGKVLWIQIVVGKKGATIQLTFDEARPRKGL